MNIRAILSLLDRREKRQLILVFLGVLAMGFIELIGVGSLGPFIAIVTTPAIIHENRYLALIYDRLGFASDASFVIAAGAAVIVTLALSNFFLAAINFGIAFYSARRRHSLSMRLLERYLRQPYAFFLSTNSAALTRNILDDVGSFVNSVLFNLLNILSCAVVTLAIVGLLIALNPLLAAAIIVILGALYMAIFTAVRGFLARKGDDRNRQNRLRFKVIGETFGGIKDIKILGKERVFLDFYRTPSLRYALDDAACNVVGDLPKFIIETVAIGGIVAVIIFLVRAGYHIEEFLPVLTIYAFGAYRLLPVLQKIFRAASSIRYNLAVVENLTGALNGLPPGVPIGAVGDGVAGAGDAPLPFHGSLRLDHVVFAYPSQDREIIRDQTLEIAVNSSVALVGPTGCGKTTFVDIILGLLEPGAGKIIVDGVEITDANRRRWQKNLGYVPQSIYLTDDTIRRNIAFGVAPDRIDDAAVVRAARMANIHDFVTGELEQGYDTVIGERGIRLSGGQRQRIGIARAIYHDPSVLILDEATSALDTITENAIIDALENLNHQKTIIMIAHRLTTVKRCDVIYLMNAGRIEDHGDYADLYARNAAFRKMADGG